MVNTRRLLIENIRRQSFVLKIVFRWDISQNTVLKRSCSATSALKEDKHIHMVTDVLRKYIAYIILGGYEYVKSVKTKTRIMGNDPGIHRYDDRSQS